MEKREIIKQMLLKSFDEPSSDKQFNGCMYAIQALYKLNIEAGMSSEFLINLRDYLLDYELN